MKRLLTLASLWAILVLKFSFFSSILGFTKERDDIGVFIMIMIITGIFTIIVGAMTNYGEKDE